MTKILHLLAEEIKTVRNYINRRLFMGAREERALVDRFHELYHTAATWGIGNTAWFGVRLRKCPLDLWVYQEMIYDLKPDIIIECGTQYGGSAFYLAHMCDLNGKGKVVTIDIKDYPEKPKHPRITYLLGSSVSKGIVDQVKATINSRDKVLVILDSDHGRDHVLAELEAYSPLVNLGGYIIVEDTNINGHPVSPGSGPGPMEAVDEFLARTDMFEIDKSKEKFYLTFNPRGYLKRIK